MFNRYFYLLLVLTLPFRMLLAQTESAHQKEVFDQAELYYSAALYEKAIPLYRQLLLQKTPSPSITLHLAKSLFLTENYPEVIALLLGRSQEELYLLAHAHCKLEQYEKAIPIFEQIIGLNPTEESHFDLGRAFYLWNKPELAEKHLSISAQTENQKLKNLSNLYLARIALSRNQSQKAEQILQSIVSTDVFTGYELAYLHGEIAFQKQGYAQAANYFEKALPKNSPEKMSWYKDARYFQGTCYLRIGEGPEITDEARLKQITKAEEIFDSLTQQFHEERFIIALSQCYLAKAKFFKDQKAYQKAEALLTQKGGMITDSRFNALLLLAEATPTYEVRDTLYFHLTQERNRSNPFYAKCWYLRGINELEEGTKRPFEEASKFFEKAKASFKKAFDLFYPEDKVNAGMVFKYEIQACLHQKSINGYSQAMRTIDSFRNHYADLLNEIEDPDEISYLYALAASYLHDYKTAEKSLKDSIALYPNGKFADKSSQLLGILLYKQERYPEAEIALAPLTKNHSDSPLAGEALLYAARCAENAADAKRAKEYRKKVFDEYPQSQWAPEAYFFYYSYGDYLQGERAAIKHLEAIVEKYPKSPFLIHAHYLVGLDFKRDRKTDLGKWIRKKNLMAAIDAFQESETKFDELLKEGCLQPDQMDKLAAVKYRAVLERALTNLEVADESQGAKRQIYLEYAEDVLKQLIDELQNPHHPLRIHLDTIVVNEHLLDESSFWLTEAYLKDNKDGAAENLLMQMIEKYRNAKITRGYFLSRAHYNLGMLAMKRHDHSQALEHLHKAEESSNVLSTEQRLDLWIQKSYCYRALNDLDNAILILSKTVNDDAVSGLRIKAMYLRAEAYERQGRKELARKQLEAVAQKRGEWAVKAQEKLNDEYGHL
jgi:tetratricopeptide (TPR) repeat protein